MTDTIDSYVLLWRISIRHKAVPVVTKSIYLTMSPVYRRKWFKRGALMASGYGRHVRKLTPDKANLQNVGLLCPAVPSVLDTCRTHSKLLSKQYEAFWTLGPKFTQVYLSYPPCTLWSHCEGLGSQLIICFVCLDSLQLLPPYFSYLLIKM